MGSSLCHQQELYNKQLLIHAGQLPPISKKDINRARKSAPIMTSTPLTYFPTTTSSRLQENDNNYDFITIAEIYAKLDSHAILTNKAELDAYLLERRPKGQKNLQVEDHKDEKINARKKADELNARLQVKYDYMKYFLAFPKSYKISISSLPFSLEVL